MVELRPTELYWREKQPWLLSCGYQLRPRFRVGWIPSWITTPCKNQFEEWRREDHLTLLKSRLMDASRLADGKPVMLKKIRKDLANEKEIGLYFCSQSLSQDPRNHCLPIEEVLSTPEEEEFEIIVMPLLRPFDSPRFDTVGECVDMFQQIFQGIQFLHHLHIAHRDCTGMNLMMDATEMFPDGYHPVEPMMNREFTKSAKHFTRTQCPPKYFWIDFGLSVKLGESDTDPQVLALCGNDRTVPEFQDPEYQLTAHDPFATDIYYLGNLIRMYFYEGHEFYGARFGLEFMKPLVADMVQDDPAKRPTIDECVTRLDEIVSSLSSWKLRSQIRHSTDNIFGYLYRLFPHWARRISYIARRIPPIPVRTESIPNFIPTDPS